MARTRFIGWSGLVKTGIDIVDLEGGHITGMSPAGAPTMVAILTNQIHKTEAAIRMRTMAARESLPVALSGNLQ